jgi:hypothetical protein
MNTDEEKKSLLLEMMAFSTVDGHLNKREYEFLFFIANELKIEKGGFNDLFNEKLPKLSMKTDFLRVQQFYRLAVLIYNDGIINLNESVVINEIGIKMRLNPEVSKRILKKMDKSSKKIISEEVLMKIFKEERS